MSEVWLLKKSFRVNLSSRVTTFEIENLCEAEKMKFWYDVPGLNPIEPGDTIETVIGELVMRWVVEKKKLVGNHKGMHEEIFCKKESKPEPLIRSMWASGDTCFEINTWNLEGNSTVTLTMDFEGDRRIFVIKKHADGTVTHQELSQDEREERDELQKRTRRWAYGCDAGDCLVVDCHKGSEYAKGCRDEQLRMKSTAHHYVDEHERIFHRVARWFK